MPLFSVLIATRDRPSLFAEGLASVLAQQFRGIEVVIVDDGSAEDNRAAYEAVLAPARRTLGERLRFERLVRRPNGHGPSYAINVAASLATGEYIAMLDDDDAWTDPGHLARAAAHLSSGEADLYMSNQRAYRGGEPVEEELWLSGLARRLGRTAPFAVTLEQLLTAPGFCHMNCLIVRRALWARIGGMDEAIRWEGDRDLFLRLVDAAGTMIHDPAFVARHNIPDPSKAANVTTATPVLMKRLDQLRVVDKAAVLAKHPAIRAIGRRHRAWTLARLTSELAAAGNRQAAAHYARSALAAKPSPGRLLDALRHAARAFRAPG